MKITKERIYAPGNAVEVLDYDKIPLVWSANRQGRIAANNIGGKKEKYKGTLGSSVAKQ